jgi:hypothetical protein
MKKTLLFLLIVILFSNFYSNSYSQSFAVGYRVGSGSFTPLDFVIKRYNETRHNAQINLTKEMDKISSLSGPVYSVGYNLGQFGFEIEIPNLKSETVTAEGIQSSNQSTVVRDMYMKMSGFELNFSYGEQIYNQGSFFAFVGGSLSVDKADPTILTRSYTKNSTAPSFSEIKAGGSVNMGIGPFVSGHLAFSSVAFFAEVRPFYKFSVTGADFFDVNTALNPSTWFNDEVEDTKGSMNYFGINARVGITVDIL